jgi:hypothetical protein
MYNTIKSDIWETKIRYVEQLFEIEIKRSKEVWWDGIRIWDKA